MDGAGPRWALVLHGGAREITPEEREASRTGCLAALEAGAAVLRGGGNAVAAVEAAIRVLEDDPTFNAGRGSVRNADGEVEMDAALMDGRGLEIGAVAALRGLRHPISVARAMLRAPPVLLVAEGARRFAEAEAAGDGPPPALTDAECRSVLARDGSDTVGAVALDSSGAIAAGTSTGGLPGKPVGRVGDSPLPGCGFYAENGVGGAAFSGDGEAIARGLLAARTMQAMEAGQAPRTALDAALARLARTGGEAGGIALDHAGHVGIAHNSPHFAVAWMVEGGAPAAALTQEEVAANG